MAYSVKVNKNGNIKVGYMLTFNKLAGAGEIAGCKGTCGGHCKGCYNSENPKKSPCYVFKSYVQYGWEKSTVVKSHVKNAIAMRQDIERAFHDIQTQIARMKKRPSICRIHASGEIERAPEFTLWNETAKMFPDITFYIYTKNFKAFSEFMENNSLASNFFVNLSVWHKSGIAAYKRFQNVENVRAFVYCDGFDYSAHGLEVKTMCPAYDEKGKLHHEMTCDKCGICFNKKAKICGCQAH